MRFSDYHPGINFCFFAAALAGTILFRHPVYLILPLCTATLWSMELKGARALGFDAFALLLAALFALWYASYHHFGVTPLWTNRVGNEITLESLLYGLMLGGTIAAVLVWLSCLHTVFTADKTVYLAGRIAPKLALFLAILLRLVPRIKTQWWHTAAARRGIGCGAGGLPERCKNRIRRHGDLDAGQHHGAVRRHAESRRGAEGPHHLLPLPLRSPGSNTGHLPLHPHHPVHDGLFAGADPNAIRPHAAFFSHNCGLRRLFRRLGGALSSTPGNGSARRIPVSPRSGTTTLKNGSPRIGAVSRFCYSDSRLTNSRNAFRLVFVLLGSQ